MRKNHKLVPGPVTKYVKVRCPDCNSEQVTFTRVSVRVNCQVCGSTLAEPTGGLTRFKGEIAAELD